MNKQQLRAAILQLEPKRDLKKSLKRDELEKIYNSVKAQHRQKKRDAALFEVIGGNPVAAWNVGRDDPASTIFVSMGWDVANTLGDLMNNYRHVYGATYLAKLVKTARESVDKPLSMAGEFVTQEDVNDLTEYLLNYLIHGPRPVLIRYPDTREMIEVIKANGYEVTIKRKEDKNNAT